MKEYWKKYHRFNEMMAGLSIAFICVMIPMAIITEIYAMLFYYVGAWLLIELIHLFIDIKNEAKNQK